MRPTGLFAIVVAACGHGASAPVVGPAPISPSAGDAGVRAPEPSVDAPIPIALPGGCHEAGDGATIYPPFEDDAPVVMSYRDGKGVHTGGFDLCDLPDRVVVVDSQTFATADPTVRKMTGAVISTGARGAAVRAPIAAGSTCLDRCNGPGGGYAGCSVDAGCTIASAAPGAKAIKLSLDERTADGVGCGPINRDYIGMCATRDRLVLMDQVACRLGGAATDPFRLRLRVYERGAARSDGRDAAAPSFERNGDFYAPDSKNGLWVYRFPDGGDGHGDFLLFFTVGAKPDATLAVAGASAPCVAWSFMPAAL